MKSVISQGVSVAKAIEAALSKAGKPEEFFVKVLEEAQSGFLGFGSKKAKIALFFKKEDLRDTDEFLSQDSYRHLFNNKSLSKQIVDQDITVKPVVDRKKGSKTPRKSIKKSAKNMDKSNLRRNSASVKKNSFVKPIIKKKNSKVDPKKEGNKQFLPKVDKKDSNLMPKKINRSKHTSEKKAVVENKKAKVDKPERKYKSSFDSATGESRWKIRSTSSKKQDGTEK